MYAFVGLVLTFISLSRHGGRTALGPGRCLFSKLTVIAGLKQGFYIMADHRLLGGRNRCLLSFRPCGRPPALMGRRTIPNRSATSRMCRRTVARSWVVGPFGRSCSRKLLGV